MTCTFRFTESIFGSLEELFEAGAPNEAGSFVLMGFADTSEGVQLYTRGVLAPQMGAWRVQEPARLAPSTAWMSQAIGLADRQGLGLAFIHSHPVGIGGPRFSGADEWMHEAMVPVMVDNLEGRPFASLVYCNGSISGSVWYRGARRELEKIAVIGNRLRRVDLHVRDVADTEAFDRHVLLWGARGQALLAQLTVGVVGAGGTGSAVAEQLVRSGVGETIVVDPDVQERTNVTRVYGSFSESVGQNKAESLAEHLRRIWGGRVEALPVGVEHRQAVNALARCDVIFGCTDNHSSRAVLNDLALQHLVSVIDVGCRIGVQEQRTRGIGCEVRLVHADTACYYCGGVVDPQTIRNEALPLEERRGLEQEGYVNGLADEPSIIPVTTSTAALGVLRFFDHVLGVLGWAPGRLMTDLHALDMFTVAASADPTCVCRQRFGIGSQRQIFSRRLGGASVQLGALRSHL